MPSYPEQLNIADYFLDDRVREGRGDRVAVVCGDRSWTYREVQALANRYANFLHARGVQSEQRVMIQLPDGIAYVGALFGILKLGAVVVMVNPNLKPEERDVITQYSRARHLFASEEIPDTSDRFENFRTHKDDAAIWLFSGGTTGRPKAVVQTHQSFANTTELYAKKCIGYRETDRTLAVPKLYFGYATGSNLFFPFSVGGTSILFPDRSTPEAICEQIRRHKPTILINVPTMINQMLALPKQDFSSLRLTTSAGEALPVELYNRWKAAYGVEILDGLGTAEQWHIFISNRPGDVKPGTLGKAVEGFDVRVCDDDGAEVPLGEVGALWVRGQSRAIGYWQLLDRTAAAFRGEWYVSGDLVSRDSEGYFTYHGRNDDMLKVGGKWVAPQEVENCLLQHPAVREVAVVGVTNADGLTKPRAYVVAKERRAGLDAELQEFVKKTIDPYKYPREVVFVDSLPRTHLGKVDRAQLRKS